MRLSKLTMLLLTVLALGCASTVLMDGNMLVERDGLWYEIDSDEPFTGTMVEYWPGGTKKVEGELLEGKVNGKVTEWYEDGEKKSETEYRDGMLHGEATGWYENGQKQAEVEFSGGEEISRQEWDEEGNLIAQ